MSAMVDMPVESAVAPAGAAAGSGADLDPVAEFGATMALLFTRARLSWKESAARVHPELQPSGYKLLSYTARAGEANAHQLAELFEMDKSVVSRQVRMLEDLGLLQSRPHEVDGRLRVLSATPAARAAIDALRRHHQEHMTAALADLTPAELAVASKVFRRLAES